MKLNMRIFEDTPFVTLEQARDAGVSARMLAYYASTGKLQRIARGIYASPSYLPESEDFRWNDLAIAAANIPGAVICLTSALAYYDLTDEIPRAHWIAVENSQSRTNFPGCRIIRMRNIELGVKELEIAGLKVKIFNKERTIVEAFKFLSFETAMKALKSYLSGEHGRPDLKKLSQYSKELRVSKVRDYISALIV